MIFPIRAFKDNYIWCLFDKTKREAWVVDPGDAAPVVKKLNELHGFLVGILLTHHHADHSGGIAELIAQYKNIKVIAGHASRVANVTQYVTENDIVTCLSHQFKILEIPGHTLDHVAFYNDEIVFSGDTLFSAGCGRVFEGTYTQMLDSLTKLKTLPGQVQIYCGHEYTLSNLKFAAAVLPDNLFIQNKMAAVEKMIADGLPSLPSTMSDEKKMNPFLMCEESAVIHAVEKQVGKKLTSVVDVFGALREWKNSF